MTAGTADSLEVLRSRVSAALADHLPRHLERLRWDADRLAAHQRDRLRAVLGCAIERSPFHARRLRGIDPDTFEVADLARLPVMTKAHLMSSFDDVVTDRRLERHLVEEHLSSSKHDPSLVLDEYVCLASGGSSGVRGVFVQTVKEYTDMGGSFMRRAVARGIAAGGPAPGGSLIAYVAAGSPIHSTGFGAATATEGPVRFVAVPATLPLAEIVARLNALQPAALSGYPSRLAQLARESQAGRLRIAPQSVTASSEMLTPQDRAIITNGFGMPVINLFAATEGLVGLSDPGEDVLTFASDMCIAELVDADHRPVPEGTPSARVLVTNLHNLTQPLIRYELTDSFVRHPDAGRGHLRATVDGRADDVFHYGNVSVHPHTIRSELTKSRAIREYQVHQTRTGVEVAIVVDDRLDDGALADALEHSLRKAGVTEPHVTVHPVDAIAHHHQTGKTTRFIPLPAQPIPRASMSTQGRVPTGLALADLRVADRELWGDGPPLEIFRDLRTKCPVHWSSGMSEYPNEPGFWSITTQKDIHTVSRDWQTFSSELGGITVQPPKNFPLNVQRAMFIGMDPPKHDRIKALFQRAFTPKRIAEHEPDIREIACAVLDGLVEKREPVDLVEAVAQPIVARVIGSFMGIAPEDDVVWARLIHGLVIADHPNLTDAAPAATEGDMPDAIARCQKLITERTEHPTDDLTSVLVHAEIDGDRLTGWETVMGFVLLMVAGIDSTKATYCSAMRALIANPDQRELLLQDPSLVPDAVEEALRMFPAFAHFRRTATRDTTLGGQSIRAGDKVVMWYASSGRDESCYEDPDRFDVRRKPEHHAFGAGGRHFCLGTALARLELRIMLEESLKRFPKMSIDDSPVMAQAIFINQLKTLPVRLYG